MQTLSIVCPDCGGKSILSSKLTTCFHCGKKLRDSYGVLNFVNSPERIAERQFYDEVYVQARNDIKRRQDIDSVWPIWNLPDAPENKIVLEKVGNLTDKTVLLLGNGESVKELIFLKMNPAHLVYSDLSAQALINIKEKFDLSNYHQQLTFAAIDAHFIPFSENTFDLIYGYAMVHHLSDLDSFFESVVKTLKPGGKAVFMDDAFSPIWHYSKQTWLKPLMKYSHKRTGISPEDYRFSMSGGFREESLVEKIKRVGGEPYFVRTSFLTYLFYRGSEKLLPRFLDKALRGRPIARLINLLDKVLCKLPIFKRNQIRLIWGLTKP